MPGAYQENPRVRWGYTAPSLLGMAAGAQKPFLSLGRDGRLCLFMQLRVVLEDWSEVLMWVAASSAVPLL